MDSAAPRPVVLLIDDQKDLRTLFRSLLEEEGFEVEVAANGEAGLAILRKGVVPKLILVDVLMPGMGGEEFIRVSLKEKLIKKDQTQLICFSSLDRESPQIQSILKWVDACEQKPWGAEAFLKLVHKYLRQH